MAARSCRCSPTVRPSLRPARSAGRCSRTFAFEDAVDPLCQCILIAVVAIGHRAAQTTMAPMDVLIIRRAVLDSAIGMVDQRLAASTRTQRLLERLTDLLGLQAVGRGSRRSCARTRRSQAQVRTDQRSADSDVGNPNLLGAFGTICSGRLSIGSDGAGSGDGYGWSCDTRGVARPVARCAARRTAGPAPRYHVRPAHGLSR